MEASRHLTNSPLAGDSCPIGLERQDLIPGVSFVVGAEARDLAYPPPEYIKDLTASFVRLLLTLPTELRLQIYDAVFEDELSAELRTSILRESRFTSNKIGLYHRKQGRDKLLYLSTGDAGENGMQRGTQYYHSGDDAIIEPWPSVAVTTAITHHLEPLRADEYFMFRQVFSRLEDFERTTGSVGLLEDVVTWFWSQMVLDLHFQHPTFGSERVGSLISSRCFSPSQTLLHARIQHLSLHLRSIRIPNSSPESYRSTNVEEEEFITLVKFAASHLPNLSTVHFSLRLTPPETRHVISKPQKQVWAREMRNLKIRPREGLEEFTYDFVVVNNERRFGYEVVELESKEELYRLLGMAMDIVGRITKPTCLEWYEGEGEWLLGECEWLQHD